MDALNVTKIILEIISLFVTSVATIVALIFGLKGYSDWRREFIGKRRIELAEEILTHFYEARDAIAYMRNPFGYVGEGESRKKEDYETKAKTQIHNEAHVKWERYQKNQEPFLKLESLKYRFMAQNGKDSIQPIIELKSIVNDVLFSARLIASYKEALLHTSDKEAAKQLYEKIHEQEVIFWDMGSSSKEFNDRIESAVSQMEGICNGIIRERTETKFIFPFWPFN